MDRREPRALAERPRDPCMLQKASRSLRARRRCERSHLRRDELSGLAGLPDVEFLPPQGLRRRDTEPSRKAPRYRRCGVADRLHRLLEGKAQALARLVEGVRVEAVALERHDLAQSFEQRCAANHAWCSTRCRCGGARCQDHRCCRGRWSRGSTNSARSFRRSSSSPRGRPQCRRTWWRSSSRAPAGGTAANSSNSCN